MKPVVITAEAGEDLLDAWRSIVDYSAQAADRYLETLEAAIQQLAEFPEKGRLRPDLAAGVRSFPVRRHLILYEVNEDTIVVLAVPHGASNYPERFEEE